MDLPSSAQPLSPEIEFLYGLRGGRMKLGLEATHRLLRLLGSPEAGLVIAQVAGTNGKGTTTAFASALLQAAGLRVGRFTSPHLLRVEERICIDGVAISEEDFRRRVRDLRPFIERAGASFFEAVTVLAAQHFRDAGVDAAVFEVGLGGRLDATTALPAAAGIVTGVSWDHEAILGPTLAAILDEKLGIVRAGVPVYTGLQDPALIARAQRTCDLRGAPLHVLPADAARVQQLDPRAGMRFQLRDLPGQDLVCRFLGAHHARHAALATAAVHQVLRTFPAASAADLAAGYAQAFLPGRFQVLPALQGVAETIVDVAHNEQSLHATLDLALRFFGDRSPVVLLGMLRDKRMEGVLERLVGWASHLVLTAPRVSRAWDVDAASRMARQTLPESVQVQAVPEVSEAVRRAYEVDCDLVLVLGSHYMVGDALPALAQRRGVTPEVLLRAPATLARA